MLAREIAYFLAVARTMNFTRAAEQCGVAQPTLTRGIQKLERELGGQLLVRERGLTHLTALGRAALPELEAMAERASALKRQAQQQSRLEQVDLRLGLMCSIGPARFGGFLSRFRAEHPGIEILLADATPERLAERLLQGEVDAALTVMPEGFGDRLRAEPIYAERFVVACGHEHPFAARESITLRDMDGQTYLLRINCEHRQVLGDALRAVGARLLLACRSEREDWIQSLAAAGMGVCFLPEYSVGMPGLVTRPVADSPSARQVCLVTVAGRRWSPALARFVKALQRTNWAP